MVVEERELEAEDYTYHLPDHWILEVKEAGEYFTKMHAAYVQRVVELVKESGARSVLEVGCGDGWNCGKLVEAGVEKVVGIDWSRKGIAYASLLVPEARFFCGDIRDDKFLREYPHPFDAVIFVEVLEHIPPADCLAALRNITRVIKLGGRLVLTTPSTNFPNNNPQHYRHFDEATIRGLIAETGKLTIDSIEGYGDVVAEGRFYRLARWVDNRYYQIKPARKWLQRLCEPQWLHTPLTRCSGLIATMTRTGS